MTTHYLAVVVVCILSVTAEPSYPCETSDLGCIGSYLADYSKCDSNYLDTSTIDPYYQKFFQIDVPAFNTSDDRTDLVYTGLSNGYVKNFFINEETDKAVLTIQVPKLDLNTTVESIYYSPGNEPFSVISRDIYFSYVDIIFTIMFKSSTDLELKNARVYTYLSNPPVYTLGDGAISRAAETNSLVATVLAEIVEYPSIAAQELWSYQGPGIASLFVNSNICSYKDPAAIPTPNARLSQQYERPAFRKRLARSRRY